MRLLGRGVSGLRLAVPALAILLAGGCAGGGASEDEAAGPPSGPMRERARTQGKLFGDDLTIGNITEGRLFGGGEGEGGERMPVNRYLWQAALDTLSFLPLDSTDPFTGVIATEWATTPGSPDERLKVTVYVQRPALEASSLRVAVFREARDEEGLWVPQAVSPETARRLEDAILTRARQIRIAEIEAEEDGEQAG